MAWLTEPRFFKPFPGNTTFDTIVGVVRLSTKYQVDPLLKRALTHLSAAFPLTADSYYAKTASEWESGLTTNAKFLRIVLFAREMAIDWILPVALYQATANCTTTELQNGLDVEGTHIELGPQDKLLCLAQSLEITRSACSEVTHFLWEPLQIPHCSSPSAYGGLNCTNSRVSARQNVEQWRREKTFPMRLWISEDWETLRVCSVCMTAMKAAHQEALNTFWDGLPQRFGLPGWEVLKQMKEAALQ